MINNFDNATGFVIDSKKIGAELSEAKGELLKIDKYLLIETGKDAGLLHTEIVLTPFNYPGQEKDQPRCSIPVWTDNPGTVAIFPKYDVHFSLEEIKREYLTGEQMTIAEFVKDRRNYNARLQNNESEVTSWLNGQ